MSAEILQFPVERVRPSEGRRSVPARSEVSLRTREQLGSEAFNLDYEKTIGDAELRDDIVSYLGEYRLNVQKFDYELAFYADSAGLSGEIRDINRGESMLQKAVRAIEERRHFGKPIHRELAEERALHSLNTQLEVAQSGDTLFWASPPGPKEEGYGDYGFFFRGKVQAATDSEGFAKKRLAMTAIRVDNPTISQYNAAMSELTGMQWELSDVDDFLANPIVVAQDIDALTVDHIMQKNFSFQMNEGEREMTDWIFTQLSPAIEDFIAVTKTGTNEEKLRAFNALENYALQLKVDYQKEKEGIVQLDDYRELKRLDQLIASHSYDPPKVGGSCGSTSNLSGYEALKKALGLDSEWFNCPKCGYEATGPIGNNGCPGCGLTKEAHAKAGGEVCEEAA